MTDGEFEFLARSYRLLRKIESRLRLMHSTSRDDLPDNPEQLAKLAAALGYVEPAALLSDCEQYSQENRRLFDQFFAKAASG